MRSKHLHQRSFGDLTLYRKIGKASDALPLFRHVDQRFDGIDHSGDGWLDIDTANWFQRPGLQFAAGCKPGRKMIVSTSPIGLAGSFAAVRDADFRRENKLIQNKTLIIAGKYDEVTKAEHSEQMHSVIAGSELVVLPVVHLTNIEAKDEFEKLVLDFLQEDLE